MIGFVTVAPMLRRTVAVKNSARLLFTLFGAQFVVGLLNVWLLAPVWMQLVHLLMADSVWIALVLLCASLLRSDHAPIRAADALPSTT